MQILKSSLPDVPIIVPRRLSDHRGFFVEAFQAERYAAIGARHPFVQDNFSRSSRGVLRGLHLQFPNAQGKLVSVFHGRILDVVVDVRKGSPNFGKSTTVELSESNGCQVFVPRGFAHGFVVLSDSADVFYKCDNFHSPADEIVIRWNDPELAIDWQIANPELSARDAAAPLLRDADRLPVYAS